MALTQDELSTIREIFAREQARSDDTSEEAGQSFWEWLGEVAGNWGGFQLLNVAWESIKAFLGF